MLLLLAKCLVYLSSFLSLALAFDFTLNTPTQCGDFVVSWTGGHPPFYLLMTPMFDVSTNITIPHSAYNNETQEGSFTTTLTFQAGTQFLLTMSDASGFGTGGTSSLLTAGPSTNPNATCNTTRTEPDFLFQLNTALQQCRVYTFSEYVNASQPVRITGLIPLGQSFELFPPVGPPSFDWIANVPGGTSITFLMTDAAGHSGGSSDMKVVGWTDNSECLDNNSPRSTVSNSATATPGALLGQGSSARPGVIAGAVIGTFAFLAIVTLFALCWVRRNRKRSNDPGAEHPEIVTVENNGANTSRVLRVRNSLLPIGRRRTHTFEPPRRPTLDDMGSSGGSLLRTSEYVPSPYILPSNGSVATMGHSELDSRGIHSRASGLSQPISSSPNGFDPVSTQTDLRSSRRPSLPLTYVSGSTSQKGSSSAGQTQYTRFILHTDADDVSAFIDGSEPIVELPPQYTDRRSVASHTTQPNPSNSDTTRSPPPTTP